VTCAHSVGKKYCYATGETVLNPVEVIRSNDFHNKQVVIQNIERETNMYNQQNLSHLDKMNELAPDIMKAFWHFDKLAVAAGSIPAKYKELIAVAVALTTQCPYCISIHTKNACNAGATDTELTEAAMVSAALRAGAAVTHATHVLAR
jgi:AhpD family alkylhydroperoxidase